MSEPEFDREEDPDSESMFDFLAEDGDRPRARKTEAANKGQRPLPIIRKPVPVSESGPLLPPKPGDPVEPPPQLTISKGDDFDFLSEGPRETTGETEDFDNEFEHNVTRLNSDREYSSSAKRRDERVDYAPDEDDRTRRMPAARMASAQMPTARMPPASNDHSLRKNSSSGDADLIFDDLDLADDFEFGSDWHKGVHTKNDYDEEQHSAGRKRLFALGIFLILTGIGSFAYSQRALWLPFFYNTDLATGQVVTRPDPMPDIEPVRVSPQVEIESSDLVSDSGSTEPPAVVNFSVTTSPLMQRFRVQLAELEALLDQGSLDEAEKVLATMDRSVYGYGAFEFGEMEAQIADIRSGVVTGIQSGDIAEDVQTPVIEQQTSEQDSLVLQEQAVVAEAQRLEQERLAQQAAVEQAQRLEQERLAEQAAVEQAQRLEQERLAQQAAVEQAQRLEQERLAQQAAVEQAQRLEQERVAEQAAVEQAQRLEQERVAQQAAVEQAQRLEQERLAEQAAVEQAQRLEQERLAQQAAVEQAQRLEQERLAQQAAVEQAQRLEQERLAAQTIDTDQPDENWQVVEADRQATDRRIAEQRAAAQRQEAREQRLTQARERADALAREENLRQQAASEAARAAAAAKALESERQSIESANTLALTSQTITDEDLQIVYQRFSNLQQAINDRDINAVIALTQRSGTRVQQFLQMFENSVSIDSRIRNVSTRNAAGEIHGTLQINGVRRADGSVIKPPASVASLSLTSKRDASGWSAIRW